MMIISIKAKESKSPVLINKSHIIYVSTTKSGTIKIVMHGGIIFHYEGDIQDIISQLDLVSL